MDVRRDRVVQAVVGLSLLALAVRLVDLGGRVAHWDEARVAYWIVEYGQTGVLFYRPVIHGPLLKLVNAPLFDLLGATDAVMRLVPALAGGLLPLTALLFRHRLRDEAVVALALLLALNPALLYYSRFMRNDVLVGAFCFLAFACLVRAVDLDDGRYLLPAALALALGFGAKENALAYLAAFVGAAGLLLGHRLVYATLEWRAARDGATGGNDDTADDDPAASGGATAGDDPAAAGNRPPGDDPLDVLREYLAWGVGGLVRHARTVAASVVLFVLAITYIYAPRGGMPSQGLYYRSCIGYDGAFDVAAQPTLGEALVNPLLLPRLVVFTVGSTAELYACQWVLPRTDDPNPYLEFLTDTALTTVESSAALVVLAVAGFGTTILAARVPDRLPDDLVTFCFYWGAASVAGYPYIADIGGASWLVVHVVLPLSVPAAYAFGGLYRWGRAAHRDDDLRRAALAVAIAVVLVGSMAWTGYATSFADPKSPDNTLVQYAQPSGDLEPTLADMRALAAEHEGTDVVLYGEHLYNPVDEELERRPTCSNWFAALPLPWYFEAGEMEVDCAPDEEALEGALADDPPVVVAHANERQAVDDRIDDRYDDRVFLMRTTDTPFVFYVDESRLD